ncbi:TPR domain protein [Talaromyces stipitatus ATCC 10500]|uniref:TPR domain protein n=1 Tax=Talaromyces stipitatus (strain ATCC 10500 / CBS 375.48 / QM 6759 / NRRL 1006) TaxID=441959 RepID=B8LXU2_TALSN|nr:TPR domain protein [Talaromyces stipitatus ATCC 10500]EED22757.1 TPR domain protein [Talaromyces stipitatus ATCC 10500]
MRAHVRLQKEHPSRRMALAGYNATFSERPETPAAPSLSIPFLRDPDFIDRATILNQLQDRCATPGSRTALVGLGGVGKSQLAIEYAYRIHEREPETWIFWIHASNAARFKQSYEELAETIKLFGWRDPKSNIFKLVHDWLRDNKNRKWILILDNVDNAHFLINRSDNIQDQAGYETSRADRSLRDYLPQSPNGSILITSRNREAALKLVNQHDIISVEPMDGTQAQALFETKLGKQDEQQHDSQDVAELAAALNFIPLAIVQAAAYISDPDRGCSVRQYVNEFQKNDRKKIRLLDHEEGQFRRDREAENKVLITWQISFESIRESRRSAADLLSLMSFFDRQGIPKALLYNHSGGDVEETHSDDDHDSEALSSVTDKFNDDILMLRRYSLISMNIDRTAFSMHNLVQVATRTWLAANGELERWQSEYIRNLNAELPSGEYENWEQCQILFPHAKSAAKLQPEGRDALIEWASVLYKAAWYDWRNGNGGEGAKLSVRAMKTWKRYLGPEHEKTLSSMELVGLINLLQGRWEEAEELFVQVMETRKRVLGAEHPDTLTSMANLASTYWNQGRWKEAEELFVQVMETRKRVLGAEHPDTLISMANLASTYRNQGRWKEAEELEVQVVETTKRVLGAEHPNTLTSMGNLASTYRNQGRWKEAEELEVQVVETTKRVLGAEHPDTLTSMANLASTYRNQGRWKEAEELEVQVMETRKMVLGAEHPDTLTSMANLASTYRNQGQWKEAEELEVQVMETRKRVLGAEHPDTLTSMANLASTYRNQGRLKEAEELEVQVMEARKMVLGAEHPDTLTSMGNLASTYWNQGRWKEAEELEVQVMETTKRVLGAEHPNTLTSMANLASTYRNQGRWKEAEELFVQVVETTKRVLGAEHLNTLTSMANLASTYWNQGRWKEAEELEVQVMETRKRVLGAEHPDTLTSMANLAFTWKEQGRDVEALNLMKDCVYLQSKVLGVEHPNTLSSAAALICWQTEVLGIDIPVANEAMLPHVSTLPLAADPPEDPYNFNHPFDRKPQYEIQMAPRLAVSTREFTRDMILSNELTTSQIAEAAQCHPSTIRRHRSNLRLFGSVTAPSNKSGRPRRLTPVMIEALCDHLLEKPQLYLDEMAIFIWDDFGVQVKTWDISRALKREGWSKKTSKQKASQRNADLRDGYMHLISDFRSYHLVYVDESGCDKRAGFRRTGWSPLGVAPAQVTKFHRDQRYQILPAYAQDGVIMYYVFKGSTDASFFENFIEELLHHCGKWPEPKSVIVMDNASFHHSKNIETMCSKAGVKLVYLPPYSPDLNPIEELFAELKAFIKRHWQTYADNPDQGFDTFLEWCIDTVGRREQSAEGHFRNSGLAIEKM